MLRVVDVALGSGVPTVIDREETTSASLLGLALPLAAAADCTASAAAAAAEADAEETMAAEADSEAIRTSTCGRCRVGGQDRMRGQRRERGRIAAARARRSGFLSVAVRKTRPLSHNMQKGQTKRGQLRVSHVSATTRQWMAEGKMEVNVQLSAPMSCPTTSLVDAL